ncbi:MAG: hypothetical protein JWP03_1858 [Phycisphaerales bacterium]|nr:hypothetical protein [Phycisphaerales bacterium]
MLHTALQIDPAELDGLVPERYADYRAIVADGLSFFLQRLSAGRLGEILAAQAGLPAGASASRRLIPLLHACPALHKLGQVIARNAHLDPMLRRQLQRLETMPSQTPAGQVRPILERELGRHMRRYRIRIAERHLAEASVAVIVPMTWSDRADPPGAPRRHAVAKLLKPGVTERLEEDLEILGRLSDYLEERQAAYGLPDLDYHQIFDEVAELLTHEVRFEHEQSHLRAAAKQFSGRTDVQVPALLPFSTSTLTAMERVYGKKVTDTHSLTASRRTGLFHAMVRALLSQVVLSRDPSVLFHGDPHAGNLFATRDGRLAILDWSLAGRLTTADREALSQIIVGGLRMDARAVARAVRNLTGRGTREVTIRTHVDEAMGQLRGLALPGPTWAMRLLDALALSGARFAPRLLLFRKAFFTLEGVLADVCPECSLEGALIGDVLAALVREWPSRLLRPPLSRDYATHVSSGDLLRIVASAPTALLRRWRPIHSHSESMFFP